MDRKEIAAKQARLDSTERKTVDDVKEATYTILDEKATSEQLRELEEKLTKQSIELHEKLTTRNSPVWMQNLPRKLMNKLTLTMVCLM